MRKMLLMYCLIVCLPLWGKTAAVTGPDTLDLAILDYDNTVEPVKQKMSTRSSEHFVALMKRGVTIAVVTMSNRKRIEKNLVKPFVSYLRENKEDMSLTENLLVFPSGGQEFYRISQEGVMTGPVYRTGLSAEKITGLERLAKEKTNCAGAYNRNTFLSLKYATARERTEAAGFFSSDETLEVYSPSYPDEEIYGYFMHLRSPGFSKEFARDYILKTVKPELEAAKGRAIAASAILVAGDKMGITEGENDDTALFVAGATNLALGKEAAEGCDQTYLGKYHEGLASWIKKYRASHPHQQDQCPALTLQTLEAVHKLSDDIIQATRKEDLLVFIGQTPAYIFPLVKEHRNAKIIAISRTKPEKTINPGQEQLKHYCRYLESEGLSDEVLRSKHLVLIDHSYMGRAIKAITGILNTCARSSKDTSFRFFNFASDWHLANNKIRPLDFKHITLEQTFSVNHDAMMNIASKGTLPRLVEEYPVEKWLTPPDFSISSEARMCLQKVTGFRRN